MKTKLLSLLTVSLLAGMSLPAANIAWVSFHAADNAPSSAAAGAGFTNAPDAGYTALLTANGHTVTRFLRVADLQNLPDLITALNTNDLVIVSRSVPSGDFDSLPETAAWNTSITVPMISVNGYINRANRLGFNTGDTIPDVNSSQMRLRVLYRAHPIFAGVSLNDTNLMINPYAERVTFTNATTGATTLQNGISVVTSAMRAGGSLLATVGTPGDAAIGGMVIAEFPAGVTSQRGDVLANKRLVFLTGSRESGITSEGAGIYDLQPDGAQMFLNAVNYLTTPQGPLPVECTTPLVGGVNLPEGSPWTFNAGVVGDTPRTYQWYKDGQPIPTGTEETLVIPSLTLADAGAYQLFVTNAGGFASSTIASLAFATFPPASITNGLISYWPLNEVQGNKTFDVVSTYDMSLINMSGADIVPGKWGNAFQFNGTNAYLERISNPSDALPIYQHPDFTVSLWVLGIAQGDRRVFSEGSLTAGNPLFNIGTHNTGADGTVDIYIRNDAGTVVGDHRHSQAWAYDGANWHNIVYVQRDIGGGNMNAQLWVDGVLDPVVITPVRPMTVQTTTIGAIRRAAASAWFNGMIDDVAVWNRALSPDEIQILQVTAITNPPVRLIPLAINRFQSDVPAVVAGGSTTLRWEVSRDVTQVTVNGADLTASTVFGSGSLSVTLNAFTNYVLTISRGVDTLSATTSVAVVDGVNPGWALLDNFDQTPLGILSAAGYWRDATGNSAQVVDTNANHTLRTATGNSISFLNLQNLSVNENQARSLFFRLIPGADNASGVTNIVGLSDKSQRGYGDAYQNLGPVLYVAAFTNELAGVLTNGWYIGARNGFAGFNTSNPIDYLAEPLEAGAVYNVWIDVTNAPLDQYFQDLTTVDTFTVYLQKLGDPTRTVAFQDYRSDRDPEWIDVVLGGMLPALDQVVVLGNNATHSALFDDFYLSSTTYNATVPRPYGFTAPQPGSLTIEVSGNQLEIGWTTGTLQHAPSVTGPWTDVPGNPSSPYLVAPSGDATFYRTRQ
ncbi:MAG: hypothetical protein KIS67_24200 [Verrucomicrobiae bacterium]|nr:hypothetical protein [Verrucomicrobiae bacterium]